MFMTFKSLSKSPVGVGKHTPRRNIVDTHHGIIAQTQKMQKRAVIGLQQWLS